VLNKILAYIALVGQDAVAGIASGRLGRIGVRNPDVRKIFRTAQNGPGAHTDTYTMVAGPFPKVKRPERSVDYPPHLAQRLKNE